MAIKKVTDLTELTTTAASDDLVMIVDVDDTTDSPEGTSKKIQVSNLGAGGGDAPAVIDNAGTPVLATGITQAEMQSVLNVDPAGTDNSTNVSINANAGDVLRMAAGQVLGSEDAGADKLVFWDDSDSKLTFATIGTNLTMTGTTLSASGGGGGGGTNQMMIPWAFFDSTLRDVYIPITSELENTSVQRYNKFVVPFAGSLTSCTIFSTLNQSGGTGITLTLRKQTGTNVYTDVESVTLSSLTNYTTSTFTFSTNTFVAGDVLAFWLTNGFSQAFGNLTGTLLFTAS